MNRTDRLLAIILSLQSKGTLRAQDLAQQFETSVRTIYRDIEAIAEAGVPVVATPGRGYALLDGFFLPPLSFTVDEATTLLLGVDFVAGQFDEQYRLAATAAGQKIEVVLPEQRRRELQDLREALHVITPAGAEGASSPAAALLGELRRAVLERRTVRFRYYARHNPNTYSMLSEREADPYTLVHITGAWYLVAYCHQRQAVRRFRLDRIERLVLTDYRFARPSTIPLPPGRNDDERPVVVRALFDDEAARWVRESRFFYIVGEEERPDGLLVTLRVRREDEIVPWLLGWGQHVRVLEPRSLTMRLASEAAAVVRLYQNPAAANR